MYFGNINDQNFEKYYPKAIKRSLDYIRQTDFNNIAKGKYPLEGNLIYAVVDEYYTKDRLIKNAEQHRKYADLQYLASGEEAIGIGFENQENIKSEEYNEAKDRLKYSKVFNEQFLTLVPGEYMVLYPSDIHRPGCFLTKSVFVKKVVVKIDVSLLSPIK